MGCSRFAVRSATAKDHVMLRCSQGGGYNFTSHWGSKLLPVQNSRQAMRLPYHCRLRCDFD